MSDERVSYYGGPQPIPGLYELDFEGEPQPVLGTKRMTFWRDEQGREMGRWEWARWLGPQEKRDRERYGEGIVAP